MAKQPKYSSKLNTNRQSTGGRPLIALCVISILVLTFYVREGDAGFLHAARGVFSTIATPVRMVGSVITSPFNAVGNAFSNITASESTLNDLRQENERLTAELAALTENQKSVERLGGLAELQTEYNLTTLTSRVIGSTGDAWSVGVTLDKGSQDGVEVGMPVCTSGGVIGQVVEVFSNSSRVRLTTDEQSGISAMIQATRAQGTLQGQPDGTLLLRYVVADSDVSVGDIVVTSGLGGSFPKGLPLGTVASVERASNDVYYTIVVRPVTTAESNEEVLVITKIEQAQKLSNEDVAAANSTPQGTTRSTKDDSEQESDNTSSSSS